VPVLDLRDHGLERGDEARRRTVCGRALVEQPGPELALLAAGEHAGPARCVGVPLDERERLQHRVVQVGRHLGALLGADALPALHAEIAPQPHDPRPEEQRHADASREHGEAELADDRQHTAAREEQGQAEHEQHTADDGPRHHGARLLTRVGRATGHAAGEAPPASPLVVVGAGPDEPEPEGARCDRPHEGCGHEQPDLAHEQQRAHDDDTEGERPLGRPRPRHPRPTRDVVARQGGPAERVEHDPHAVGEGQHDHREPHDHRVESEAGAHAPAHAGQDAVVLRAGEIRQLQAGRPHEGATGHGHGRVMIPRTASSPHRGPRPGEP
jgi:hypothetical protein